MPEPGIVECAFESVNWTQASDLASIKADPATFQRRSSVFVVPADYIGGSVPPSEEDIAAWASGKRLPIAEARRYFVTVNPEKGTQANSYQTHATVQLPANYDYLVYVEAGSRRVSANPEAALHPTDPYDNMDVTIRTKSYTVAPDLSATRDETIILGDEFDRVTMRLSDGRVVPNPQSSEPETENAIGRGGVPRLLKRAYAKYHPRVENPEAPFNRDERTFVTRPGIRYEFSTDVSGIDWKIVGLVGGPLNNPDSQWPFVLSEVIMSNNKMTIQNGKETYTVVFAQNLVLYYKDENLIIVETFANNGYLRRYEKDSAGTFQLVEEALPKEDPYAVELKQKRGTGSQSVWVYQKIVAEKDQNGQWYLSRWEKRSEEDSYSFVARERVEDEFEALQSVSCYQLGSIKRLKIQLIAKADRIPVTFKSFMFQSETKCDELRFDHIQMQAQK